MKKIFLFAILFFANASALFAVDLPCGGTDIDPGNCPIDTWIIVFAALSLIITTIHLHKRQMKAVKLLDN